jgi:hypothetical protein
VSAPHEPLDAPDRGYRPLAEEDDETHRAQDEADPWALSLVLRVERPGSDGGPPARTDALAAAVRAVVALLTDPRTTDPEGELHDAVAHWRAGRIRKIARRARGARWERTASLPHAEASAGTATVRAFAPHPRDQAPALLRDLQVGGLELADPEGWAPPPVPAPALTVRLTPGVAMTTGKALAQVGHAGQLALEQLDPALVRAWLDAGTGVRVVPGAPVLPAAERVDVRDGGFTEVLPGTVTASAGFEG